MRVVALEEHFSVPSAAKKISPEAVTKRGYGPRVVMPGKISPLELLPDLGAARLKSMDEHGITVQVLSASGPGADLVDGADGIAIAKEVNEALAAAVAQHPTRYAGFAHLPLRSPAESAKELERCVKTHGFHGAMVNGTTDGLFLDDPGFDPLLSAAEALDVPIYIHPHLPPAAVRQAYYANLPGSAGDTLAAASWGWHSETAIHVLRMVFAGTFDKHPKLKIVIGHMGEGLPLMLARIDDVGAGGSRHLEEKAERDDARAGVADVERHVHAAAAAGLHPHLGARPHHVLGRLSVCEQRTGCRTAPHAAVLAGRQRQVLPWHRRPAAAAEGVKGNFRARARSEAGLALRRGKVPPDPLLFVMRWAGVRSVRHQHRHRHVLQDTAAGAAEHELAEAGAAVGAHDEQVGAEVGQTRQQLVAGFELGADRARHLALDAMSRQRRGELAAGAGVVGIVGACG